MEAEKTVMVFAFLWINPCTVFTVSGSIVQVFGIPRLRTFPFRSVNQSSKHLVGKIFKSPPPLRDICKMILV